MTGRGDGVRRRGMSEQIGGRGTARKNRERELRECGQEHGRVRVYMFTSTDVNACVCIDVFMCVYLCDVCVCVQLCDVM